MPTSSSKTVTVVVPCYNYAKYLPDCIESLSKQTLKPLEVIIVNDGSPDNTTEVANELIAKYPDLPLRLLVKENGGLSSARNAAITEAKGELIMSLDADDKILPGALEEHVRLIGDNPRAFAQCALMEFGDRHTIAVPTYPLTVQRIMQANTVFSNAMFPRTAWVEVGGYDESPVMRKGYEDWEFWLRLLAAGYELKASDMICFRYRVHEGQMSQATAHPNAQELYQYIMTKHKDLYEKYDLKIVGYN